MRASELPPKVARWESESYFYCFNSWRLQVPGTNRPNIGGDPKGEKSIAKDPRVFGPFMTGTCSSGRRCPKEAHIEGLFSDESSISHKVQK